MEVQAGMVPGTQSGFPSVICRTESLEKKEDVAVV